MTSSVSPITIIFSEKLTKFSTKDKIRLMLAIYSWVYDNVDTPQEKVLAQALQGWKIFLHASEESTSEEFANLVADEDKLDNGIPHGITYKNVKQVHVFMNNLSSYPPFFPGMRQAFNTAISHEIGHMIIAAIVNLGKLEPRRRRSYRDKLNAPGTVANTEVVIIHDGIAEIELGIRKPRIMKIPAFSVKNRVLGSILKFFSFQVSGIDIREYIDRL